MTKTRNLSDLLDSNGDVKSTALDNVPASNDASALTTGTLPNARLSAVPNSALANSSITINGTATALGGSATINTDLVNDTTPQLGGNLDCNTFDISFGDNEKARFGNADDLQIYHDGTHSYIKDTGTGDLYLQGSANVRLTNLTGSKMFLGQDGGEAQLYYAGVEKLATKSTGVNVTGTLSATAFSGDGSGLTNLSAGKIGQVIQGVKSDVGSINSSTFSAISGLTATITPSSTSSKILASVNLQIGQSSSTTALFKLYRGSQAVGYANSNGSRQQVSFRVSPDNIHWTFPVSYQYLDSPSTTSATTYYVYWRSNGNTVHINRNDSYGNDSSPDASVTISTITLMEILP